MLSNWIYVLFFFLSSDFYGVRAQSRGELTVFLPQASEEYGPISHYYLIVIPNSNASEVKYPDQYVTVDLVANSKAAIDDGEQRGECKRPLELPYELSHKLPLELLRKLPLELPYELRYA